MSPTPRGEVAPARPVPPDEPAERWEGATAAELAGRWGLPRVALYRCVGSTNDAARSLAAGGAPAWTVALAEEQCAGRGRGGRGWASPPGVGIWLSFVLRDRSAEELPLLPLRVGLAAARALDGFAGGESVRIKWPNDLLLGGRKLGGILAEAVWAGSRPAFVVVGIGINTGHADEDFPPELRATATSLRRYAGAAPSRAEVAAAVLRELRAGLSAADPRLSDAEAAELAARDALRGRQVEVTGAGEPLRGVALGIATDGALRLRTPAGAEHLARSGSVRPYDAAPAEAAARAAPSGAVSAPRPRPGGAR